MLPSSLLVVWKREGEIAPRFAKLSKVNLEVADALIKAYHGHVGEKKRVLKAVVADLENGGVEYRFARGLGLLLDRRGTFVCKTRINPIELRRRVFELTQELGLPISFEERQRILQAVASEFSLSVGGLEELLYADLDDELILERFNPPGASELLLQYNLSLAQTLLFDSAELSFTVSGNWQKLFYLVKKLGLIYEVSQSGDGFWVKIDGPASLFKLTRRYGVGIAKLLPVIVGSSEWAANAKILWRYTNQVCDFKVDSRRHGCLFGVSSILPVAFDSAVEERFASMFKAVDSGWTLKREPEPIIAGKQVIIPDFSLQRGNLKVYMEIVGFWTEQYLQRKVEKLRLVGSKMLLLVDEVLACEKLDALKVRPQLDIIYYRNKVSLAPVLRYLERLFEEKKVSEVKFLENLQIKLVEPVVVYDEFAARVGVSVEAVKSTLASRSYSDYVVFPNSLVSAEKMKQIDAQLGERLGQSQKLSFAEAVEMIEAEGVKDASSALTELGYRVKWRGIDHSQAEVTKDK